MNKEQFSKVAEAELDLNNALVNADISNGYEEYLALFDYFYDENVEVASDSNPDPVVGKARILPVIFNFLMPLHVMAEIRSSPSAFDVLHSFSDKRGEQHSEWSLDLVGASGRSVMVSWSFARRWKDARVIYERHSDHRQFGEALTIIDLYVSERLSVREGSKHHDKSLDPDLRAEGLSNSIHSKPIHW